MNFSNREETLTNGVISTECFFSSELHAEELRELFSFLTQHILLTDTITTVDKLESYGVEKLKEILDAAMKKYWDIDKIAYNIFQYQKHLNGRCLFGAFRNIVNEHYSIDMPDSCFSKIYVYAHMCDSCDNEPIFKTQVMLTLNDGELINIVNKQKVSISNTIVIKNINAIKKENSCNGHRPSVFVFDDFGYQLKKEL